MHKLINNFVLNNTEILQVQNSMPLYMKNFTPQYTETAPHSVLQQIMYNPYQKRFSLEIKILLEKKNLIQHGK